MKRNIFLSLVGSYATMAVWIMALQNVPTQPKDFFRAFGFASLMGIGCGVAVSLGSKSDKIAKVEPPQKSEQQLMISEMNKLIAEGLVSPETGVEVKEAIAHKIAQDTIQNAQYPMIM